MINPQGIPQIEGDLAALSRHGTKLQHIGSGFADTGNAVHQAFQGLDVSYDSPEIAILLSATLPVKAKSGTVGISLGEVGTALVNFANAAMPIQAKFRELRTQGMGILHEINTYAEQGHSKPIPTWSPAAPMMQAPSTDWHDDEDLVSRHNALQDEVAVWVDKWMATQRECANAIIRAYGGNQFYRADNGDGKKEATEFGYSAQQLQSAADQGQQLPWGTPEDDTTDPGEALLGTLHGFFGDGLWGTVRDSVVAIGDLTGINGEEAFDNAWSGLGALAGFDPDTGDWSLGTAGTAWKAVFKDFVAWDMWSKDPSRAFGQVFFNALTLPFMAFKAGKVAKGATSAIKHNGVKGAVGNKVTGLADNLKNMRVGDVVPNAAEHFKLKMDNIKANLNNWRDTLGGGQLAPAGGTPGNGHTFTPEHPGGQANIDNNSSGSSRPNSSHHDGNSAGSAGLDTPAPDAASPNTHGDLGTPDGPPNIDAPDGSTPDVGGTDGTQRDAGGFPDSVADSSSVEHYDSGGRTLPTPELSHPHQDLLSQVDLQELSQNPNRQELALKPGLPDDHPAVQELVPSNYDPYGGLGHQRWNEVYWPSGETNRFGNPILEWPDPQEHPEGFNAPEERNPVVIEPGTRLDRFGHGFGAFTSPAGVPFPDRALPPGSLGSGYHQYEVVRPIPAWEGRAAPAMAQDGGGIQQFMPAPIIDLVNAGYLREVAPE